MVHKLHFQYRSLWVPYRAAPHEHGGTQAHSPAALLLLCPAAIAPPCSFSSVCVAAVARTSASRVLSPSLACQTRSSAGTPTAASARHSGHGGSNDCVGGRSSA